MNDNKQQDDIIGENLENGCPGCGNTDDFGQLISSNYAFYLIEDGKFVSNGGSNFEEPGGKITCNKCEYEFSYNVPIAEEEECDGG